MISINLTTLLFVYTNFGLNEKKKCQHLKFFILFLLYYSLIENSKYQLFKLNFFQILFLIIKNKMSLTQMDCQLFMLKW